MDPVGHYGQNGPCTRSNDPRSSYEVNWSPRLKRPIFKVKQTPEQDLLVNQKSDVIFAKKFTWTSVRTLAMEQIGRHGQNGPFSRSNDSRSSPRDLLVTLNSDVIFTKNLHGPPLRPSIWSQLVSTDKTAYFQVQTSPE
ncbi:hypothetical protein H5410_049330 [Solanum commersonii]|uniref:Uncharacterized protein n=1 Tax=Solanum commersonii TaxID=4109 RepID=A0A9J5WTT5_SOLCO|nr:hypothetical protein H5410_049330 [Solanum commersonii]